MECFTREPNVSILIILHRAMTLMQSMTSLILIFHHLGKMIESFFFYLVLKIFQKERYCIIAKNGGDVELLVFSIRVSLILGMNC